MNLALLKLKELIFSPLNMIASNLIEESESSSYGAHKFELAGKSIIFRMAKITPKKAGQFVTLWKRGKNGSIEPFHHLDSADFFIINTHTDYHCGQFIFPKSILCERNIVSFKDKIGKRAIRVYPPWIININYQAKKTQKWQLDYFLDLSAHTIVDYSRAKKLYGLD